MFVYTFLYIFVYLLYNVGLILDLARNRGGPQQYTLKNVEHPEHLPKFTLSVEGSVSLFVIHYDSKCFTIKYELQKSSFKVIVRFEMLGT